MAKTNLRRLQVLKLQKKWERLLRSTNSGRDLKCITFGKVFSQDPFDCGNPRCRLCSFGKVCHPKEQRQQRRSEERAIWEELSLSYEDDTN